MIDLYEAFTMGSGIPDKLYFKIGEVAELASLRPSVLRFWETEFTLLKPVKSRSGQRLYSRKDVELIFEIKRLLYSEKLTIEGARKQIQGKSRGVQVAQGHSPDDLRVVLSQIRDELRALRELL